MVSRSTCYGLSPGCCGYCINCLVSIKYEEFIVQLSNYQLVNKDSFTYSKLINYLIMYFFVVNFVGSVTSLRGADCCTLDANLTKCNFTPINRFWLELKAFFVVFTAFCSSFNPLNTKRRLLYLKTQFVPRSKHFSSRL